VTHSDKPTSGSPRLAGSRRPSIGVILRHPARLLGIEPFFMEFVRGVESVLAAHDAILVLQVQPGIDEEVDSYRRWHDRKLVDGVILVNIRVADTRLDLLERMGVPTVVVGHPQAAHGLACVWTDDRTVMENAVEYLVGLGHRRLARVTGPEDLLHTQERTSAFHDAAGRRGATGTIEPGDYSKASGVAATARLLAVDVDDRATAIIYDNDVMALAGLELLNAKGVDVPGDISLIAWDDSFQSQLAAMSALSHDVYAYGALVADTMMATLRRKAPGLAQAELPMLVERGTTGPPAARTGLRRDMQHQG
jgi:DNA-binding LacI/PurR family transcriptional regulator